MKAVNPKQRPRKPVFEEFLSVSETAEELHSSNDFVRDEIKRRRLAVHRFGWRLLISRADLNAYLKRTRVAAFGERELRAAK